MAIAGIAAVGVATAVGSAVSKNKAAKKSASQQAEAANAASDYQREYTGQAIDAQQAQYDRARKDLLDNQAAIKASYDPYMSTGMAANNQLGYAMGLGGTGTGEAGALARPFTMADFEADPGYAFRLAEGQKALDRVTSAKGKYYSGGAVKALSDYNQGMATDEYTKAYDRYTKNQSDLYGRLSGVRDAGMNATGSVANLSSNTQGQLNAAGQNYANQVGGYLTGLGNNVGSNTIQAGNAHAAGTAGSGQAWSTGIQGVGNSVIGAMGSYGGMMGGGA